MAMQVKREQVGEAVVYEVEGSVDLYSSPRLRGELKTALDQKAPLIVADLGGVSFVDSSGLATLIEAMQGVKKYEGTLRLCNLSSTVLGVFQLANLDHIFEIKETRDQALEN